MQLKNITPVDNLGQITSKHEDSGTSLSSFHHFEQTRLTTLLDKSVIIQYLFSIRCTLTILLVSQIVISSFLIWLVSFVMGVTHSNTQTKLYMNTLVSTVTLSINHHLSANEINSKIIADDYHAMRLFELSDFKALLFRNSKIYQNTMVSIGLVSPVRYYSYENVPTNNGTQLLWEQLINGTTLYSWNVDPKTGNILEYASKTSYNLLTRAWYITGMQADPTGSWAPIYTTAATNQLSTVFCMPIFNSTEPNTSIDELAKRKRVGVVKTNLNFHFLDSYLAGIKIPTNGFIVVTEWDGLLISSSLGVSPLDGAARIRITNIKEKSIDQIAKHYIRNNETISNEKSESITTSTAKYLVTVTPFQFNNMKWMVYVALEQKQVFKSLTRSIFVSLGVSIVIVCVSISIVFFGAYLISRPLLNLSDKMESIQKADLYRGKKDSESLISEVRYLQGHFGKMETAIHGFFKYVPAEVVRDMMNQPKGSVRFEPGVKPKDIAIMFTDIVQFTEISEQTEPVMLVETMTIYFETLCRVIANHDGTLDKYIGDALMVLFNCPTDLLDYEALACDCALEISREINSLNDLFTSVGKPRFETRIGIHVGNCLVGNVGSSFRLSYTALGDPVNASSRIESLNRTYGTKIIISGECELKVRGRFLCRLLDTVTVKGKSKSMKLYELINNMDLCHEEEVRLVNSYNSVIEDLYYNRKFQEAADTLKQFMFRSQFDDTATKILLQRCVEYIDAPPHDTWNGVQKMYSK
jgi:class 3 adenylate cyclase